jgi:protein-disulfide isomerase
LKQARLQQARDAFYKRLRDKAHVAIMLSPPRIQVGVDPARLKGNPDAPVTIVEFSDFQCPYYQKVQASLQEVLAKYGGRVSLAFRDYPLRDIHPRARAAAEATRCAGEQGQFWAYHDLLYANQSKLAPATLRNHARDLGMDAGAFEACQASGKHASTVEADVKEGARAGVSSTPSSFINGIFLSGAQAAPAFEKLIDAELAAVQR